MEISPEPDLEPVTPFDETPTGDKKADSGSDENHI